MFKVISPLIEGGPERHGDDHDGVDHLTHQGAEVVANPEVLAFGHPLPEVKQLDVAVLGSDVGEHRGKHRPRSGGIDQLVEPYGLLHDVAVGQGDGRG